MKHLNVCMCEEQGEEEWKPMYWKVAFDSHKLIFEKGLHHPAMPLLQGAGDLENSTSLGPPLYLFGCEGSSLTRGHGAYGMPWWIGIR